MTVRITRKTAQLLQVLLDARKFRVQVSIADMVKGAQVSRRKFDSLIAALQNAEWVEEEWEVVPTGQNRPRHLYYKLTPHGATKAEQALRARAKRSGLLDMIMKGLMK
jgi:DNA-binding PadR family transcriptional regulator